MVSVREIDLLEISGRRLRLPLVDEQTTVEVQACSVVRRELRFPAANRQVDFAAPGSDFAAASLTGGYAAVRGTSYAAPIVAGLIARRGANAVAADAVDLGARGADQVFGAGLVGQDVRDGARRLARR